MAIEIQINNFIFLTKKAAKDQVRNIINKYDNNCDLQGEDLSFIENLLEIHPESDQKKGCGVARIYIDNDHHWNKNRCFYLERLDGTTTDFSWLVCFDGRNVRREVYDAFRNAIANEVDTYKASQLRMKLKCPYTDEEINKHNAHVDHKAPNTFFVLVNSFLKNESMNLLDVKITEPKDNQFTTLMTDNAFSDKWKCYHQKNAVLRIISKTGNLSHAKKSTI